MNVHRPHKTSRIEVLLILSGSVLILSGSLLAGLSAAGAADTSKGRKVYELKCLTCHGKAGKGDGPTSQGLDKKPRNFTEPDFLKTHTDADIKKTILEGKPPMPAFKGALKDKDIDNVIPYVKSLAVSGHTSMKESGEADGIDK